MSQSKSATLQNEKDYNVWLFYQSLGSGSGREFFYTSLT